jgi:hypothetical protein
MAQIHKTRIEEMVSFVSLVASQNTMYTLDTRPWILAILFQVRHNFPL